MNGYFPVGGAAGVAEQTVTSRMVDLTHDRAQVTTAETTTSTSYADLATVGPAITLSPGVTQDRWLGIYGRMHNSTNTSYSLMGVSIGGAAVGVVDLCFNTTTTEIAQSVTTRTTGATSGSTDTNKYRVSANTGTFSNRSIHGFSY